MRVSLDPNFDLEWDGLCFRLIPIKVIEAGRLTKPENVGKRRDGDPWFYSKLQHALLSYVDKAVLAGEGTADLSSIHQRLHDIHETIKQVAATWQPPEPLTPKAEE